MLHCLCLSVVFIHYCRFSTFFLLMDLSSSLMFVSTFWWALRCHHCLCLFCTHMYLLFGCFLFLIFLLLLTWHYENWKVLMLLYQTLVWPPFCPHHFHVFCELFCIFCHPLAPVCSGFYIPTQSGGCTFILVSSWHWNLYSVLCPGLLLSGPSLPPLSWPMLILACWWLHLSFCFFFQLCYHNHIIIIYAIYQLFF